MQRGAVNQLSSTTDTTKPEVVDNARDQLVADIRATLGDAVLEIFIKPGDDIWVRVRTESWL